MKVTTRPDVRASQASPSPATPTPHSAPAAESQDPEATLASQIAALRLVGRDAPARPHGIKPEAPGYDELHDQSGKIREHYRATWKAADKISRKRRAKIDNFTFKSFGGDNMLHPLPRILTASEQQTLQQGVIQRATALERFLADHHSGVKTYTSVLPAAVVDAITTRSHEKDLQGLIPLDQIAFPYGPDVMRAQNGKFYVIEDNPGFIGGPGDLLKARELIKKLHPKLEKWHQILDEPADYYRSIVARAHQRAIPANGKLVMFTDPPYADKEHKRLKAIMKDLGVKVLKQDTKTRLVVNEQGVFYSKKTGRTTPVGFVFLNGEHKWLDSSHPLMRKAYLLSEAEESLSEVDTPTKRRTLEDALEAKTPTGEPDLTAVKKALLSTGVMDKGFIADAAPAKGLISAILGHKVATDYCPGIDFIGDKEFKSYVDSLVRFYMKEEPILPSIPAEQFTEWRTKPQERSVDGVDSATERVLDQDKLNMYFKDNNFKKHVFKVVDGRGGYGVHIGPKMTSADAASVKEEIRARPAGYVVEPFMPLSELDNHIVDLRLIASVSSRGVDVSPTPWGRGVPVYGDGKVNLSQTGREFAVIVVPDAEQKKSRPGKSLS